MLVLAEKFKPTPGISRQMVESTSIQSIGLDYTNNTLEIEWPRGTLYQYRCENFGAEMQKHFFAMIEAGKRNEAGDLVGEYRNADSYFNKHLRGALGVEYCRLSSQSSSK